MNIFRRLLRVKVKILCTFQMDLISTKVLVLVLLLLIKLFSGLAPLFLTKIFKKRGDRFLKKFIGKLFCGSMPKYNVVKYFPM